ncbi:hypothetical protein [Streptosporangium sandarakinum]|uniref:pectate lyase family protein n=1 Tax=Streptosporangium sandarakinum TaxID=1260955 RepID=UPI00344699CE
MANGVYTLVSASSGKCVDVAGGSTVTVTTYADLVEYATASAPYIIRVNGAVTATPSGNEIKVASNKTIIGVGAGGQVVSGGFHLGVGAHNVITENLTIRDTRVASDGPDDKEFDYDGIQTDPAHHIWTDRNTIVRMDDGLIDGRQDTGYPTVSWNVIAEPKQTGSTCVGCSGQQETGGSAFTPSSFHPYRLDPAANVPNPVRTYAGPQASIGL